MPKRLVKKQAIIELGYPFEEEEDFFVVRRALEKEHIDEIIRISENYKESEKTTYVFADKSEIVEAAPPPPPPPMMVPPPPPVMVAPPPPPQPMPMPAPAPSVVYAQSVRSASPPRHETYEERIEESNHIGGPLTVLVPEGRHSHSEERRMTHVSRDTRTEREIKEEIRALEAERRMLKYEREGDRDYEFIERERPRNVVRVEKDRKGRLALVRSSR